MKKLIAAYNKDGFQLSGSGDTTVNGVLYQVLFFSSPAKGSSIVMVNQATDEFAEYRGTMLQGKMSKEFGN